MHLPHQALHFLKNRELDELYASFAIRSFAISMIGIFIPIYLLQLDYSLSSVLLFYAMSHGVHALFLIPSARIAARFGFKHSIFFSTPILIALFLLLFTLDHYQWPLYFLALLLGISNSLFWVGYHVDFAKFSDHDHRGEEVGIARITSLGFQVLGPLAGGLILTFLGFGPLFILASLVLFLSALPLFMSGDIHEPMAFSVRGVFRGEKIRDFFASLGYGIEGGAMMVIWPIFIFSSILHSFTAVGSVFSLSLFVSMVSLFVVGKFSDVKRRFVLRVGSFLSAAAWALRVFVKTSAQVFAVDSFYGLARSFTVVPFVALSYDKANEGNIVKFIVFKETGVQLGKVLLFVLIAIISDFTTAFVLSSGASLLFLLF